ncbi:MAG: ribosomal RNA small subunit methyltransferase A [Deltaproteobacteria bacterium]|nr:ribosomal RNA small subunit methyltransferase A [Deltaproteobacteria bacterium]
MRSKPSLGQNFLQNVSVVEKIISFAQLRPDDTVLEIGPGKGILTEFLARHVKLVVAIEKDDHLFEGLINRFWGSPNIKFIHGDILKYDIKRHITKGTKVVANLPYNIASLIIMGFIEDAFCFSDIIIMVQKEVGERICATRGSKSYSAFTVIVSTCFDPIPGFIVTPRNFYPIPKVDSMVVRLRSKKIPIVEKADMDMFKKIVYSAFRARRKMLKNSLMCLPGIDQGLLQKIADLAHIDLSLRPQHLSPYDFCRMSKVYKTLCIPDNITTHGI